jgi:dienelactone hydrolase
MRRLMCFALLAVSSAVQAAAGFAHLERGQYNVGTRIVQQYDYTRAYKEKFDVVTGKASVGERARPIQTLVWYPAQSGGTPVKYLDYVRTEATEADFDRPQAQVDEFIQNKLAVASTNIGATPAKAAFEQRMWAALDAKPLGGKFPVVIYAPGGGGAAYEAADIGEFFASHGYIVIASRSMAARGPMMTVDLEGLDAQARDIGFLLSWAGTLPQADMAHVAVAGWSWGGMTNVFAAARDNRIAALVSLDGTREPDFTRKIAPTQVTIPWLYISRHLESIPELNKQGIETSFSLLNELKYSDIHQVVMNPMVHLDFSSAFLRFQPPTHFIEYSREEVEQAYYWTARYMLEFFNANLKGDARAHAFLDRSPVENGMPRHMAKIQHTAAAMGPVPTRSGFAAQLAARGFDHALEVYRELHQRDPAFVLSEGDINQWGYALLAENTHDAIEMFRLGVALYPTSSNLHDSLGEAYEKTKETPAAIASYRRSLELDPNNAHGAQRLKILL